MDLAFGGLDHLPDEQVAFLRTALGAAAVACPQIDVGPGFAAIVKAALASANMNMTFSPYDDDLDFLLGERPHLCTFPHDALHLVRAKTWRSTCQSKPCNVNHIYWSEHVFSTNPCVWSRLATASSSHP